MRRTAILRPVESVPETVISSAWGLGASPTVGPAIELGVSSNYDELWQFSNQHLSSEHRNQAQFRSTQVTM